MGNNTAAKITLGRQMETMIARAVSARNRHELLNLKDTFSGAAARVQQELDKMPAEEKNNVIGPTRYW